MKREEEARRKLPGRIFENIFLMCFSCSAVASVIKLIEFPKKGNKCMHSIKT
jgi:SNF family Na+-dependent transporter